MPLPSRVKNRSKVESRQFAHLWIEEGERERGIKKIEEGEKETGDKG
jgi:hypothetical protein